jgi:hypothetical protein
MQECRLMPDADEILTSFEIMFQVIEFMFKPTLFIQQTNVIRITGVLLLPSSGNSLMRQDSLSST